MQYDARTTLLLTSLGVMGAALAFVWLVLVQGSVASPEVAVGLAFGLGTIVAVLSSVAIAARIRLRSRLIVEAGRRFALGDLSRPGPHYGDDELGVAARALDVAVHEQERRIIALSRDRARMHAILTSMVEGVLVCDGDGHLQLINDAARRMLRLDGDALGRSYVEALRQPEVVAPIGRILDGGGPLAVEFSTHRDVARDFVARLGPVSGTGKGVVVVLHDVTDLKRTDQIRRDFVANVSHELRTPLTAIRGYADALADDPDDTERHRFVEVIQRHVTRMERLVADLLRLALLDAGKEALECLPTDVPTLVDDVVHDLTPVAEARHVRFVVHVDADTANVNVDAAKAHDILRNLVENAAVYTREGDTVEIRGRHDGRALMLSVRDHGPGIPPEDLNRVFERFYRVDKSRGRPGGTGLGLAIVKHLAETHGGSVTVANEPDGGARFDVRLPFGGAR